MERALTPLEEAFAAITEFQPCGLIAFEDDAHVRVFAPDLEEVDIARIAAVAKANTLELRLAGGCFELSERELADFEVPEVPEEVAAEAVSE